MSRSDHDVDPRPLGFVHLCAAGLLVVGIAAVVVGIFVGFLYVVPAVGASNPDLSGRAVLALGFAPSGIPVALVIWAAIALMNECDEAEARRRPRSG